MPKSIIYTESIETFDFDVDYINKVELPHSWIFDNRKIVDTYIKKCNFITFKCGKCHLKAVGICSDNYYPPIYTYYVKTSEEKHLSCDERLIKEIIK